MWFGLHAVCLAVCEDLFLLHIRLFSIAMENIERCALGLQTPVRNNPTFALRKTVSGGNNSSLPTKNQKKNVRVD